MPQSRQLPAVVLVATAWLAAVGMSLADPPPTPIAAVNAAVPCLAANPPTCEAYSLPPAPTTAPSTATDVGSSAARISIRNVFRSFVPVGAAADAKVRLPGHVITLEGDAAAHFSVLPPATGCGSGAGASVDVTARSYAKHRHHVVALACDAASPSAVCRAGAWAPGRDGGEARRQRLWVTSTVRGCRVATNAGLFNTTDWGCHGSLVSDGVRGASRHRRLPYFGTAAGTAWVGYLKEADVAAVYGTSSSEGGRGASSTRAAVEKALGLLAPGVQRSGGAEAQLVSGLVWLVRGGKSYVATGTPAAVEDGSIQESGTLDRFIRVASGRTMVGVTADAPHRVVIAQVDGRSDWLGLDLASFAAWGVDSLRLAAAINLDGGASSTFVRAGVVANVPTYNCHMPGASFDVFGGGNDTDVAQPAGRRAAEGDQPPRADDPNFRCKRPVGSVLCLHDDPPAPVVNATSGRLMLHHGCVCFPLRTGSSAARAAMAGDARFGVDDVLSLVQLGAAGEAPDGGAARRLSAVDLRPLDAVLAAAGGPLPLGRRRAAADGDGGVPMCLCTPSAAAAATAATAAGGRDTDWESGAPTAGAHAVGDDATPPMFELYHLSRVPPAPPASWGGTVEYGFGVDDVLDWVAQPATKAGPAGSNNYTQPCTDVAALAHVLPLCVRGVLVGGGGAGSALLPASARVSAPVFALTITLLTGLGAWFARAVIAHRRLPHPAAPTSYAAVTPAAVAALDASPQLDVPSAVDDVEVGDVDAGNDADRQ